MPSPSEREAVNWVAPNKIRALFNDSQYSEKIKRGLLQKIVQGKHFCKSQTKRVNRRERIQRSYYIRIRKRTPLLLFTNMYDRMVELEPAESHILNA